MPDRLALVFSGGGARGAFGVGVLWRIVERFPGLRWGIVSGTSTGALITPLAALARDDRKALRDLRDLYLKARKGDIVESNFGFPQILRGLTDLPEGLYNFEPLRERIKKALPPERLQALGASEVVAVVNAMSLQTGGLVLCTQDRFRQGLQDWFAAREAKGGVPATRFLEFRNFVKGMVASASIPGAVEPVRAWHDPEEQLADGGVIDIAPLRAAIAAGASHLLVFVMSPLVPRRRTKRVENLLAAAVLAIDHLTGEIVRNDVEHAGRTTDLRGLAARLLEEEGSLPSRTREWVAAHREDVQSMAERVEVQVEVIEPPKALGEALDFDSDVRKGWPDAVVKGSTEKVNVMRARFECGLRAADAAVERDGVRAMLERFS